MKNTTPQRRNFLKLAGASAFAATGTSLLARNVSAAIDTAADASTEAESVALQALDRSDEMGVVIRDEFVRRGMSKDFGYFVHRLPSAVVFPKSARDVQRAVKYASKSGLKIVARGAGGAAYGQSQIEKGLVLSLSSMTNMVWVAADQIDVQPGALWADIVDFAAKRGMSPPVLPDTMFISAGGTLSAGGFGETSYNQGAQVDHVVEIEVVTGSGKILTCSEKKNTELFKTCLAGMGQCGVMTRIRLKLFATKNLVVTTRTFKYPGQDYATYLADLAMVACNEKDGAIGGHIVKQADGSWVFVLEISVWSNPSTTPAWLSNIHGTMDAAVKTWSFYDYAHRNSKGYVDAVASGGVVVPHPYMSYFVNDSDAPTMIDHILNTPGVALGAGKIALFPAVTANFKQPLAAMPKSPMAFHIRLYRKAAAEGSPDHLEMIRVNKEDLLPRVLASGGTMYLPFSPLLDQKQIVANFGWVTFARFSAAKKSYDPKNLLGEGSGIF